MEKISKVEWSFADTAHGEVMIAATPKGVCMLVFVNDGAGPRAYDGEAALAELQAMFPDATLEQRLTPVMRQALEAFSGRDVDVPLDLVGTPFQVAVWRALLEIPRGEVVSYGEIARRVGRPRAVRAVGSAVGANPVSVVVPCHRVVRSDGSLGGYGWGLPRKLALLRAETLQI